MGLSACSKPTKLPHARVVRVEMTEYKFDYRHPITEGRTVFRAFNEGELEHEMLLAVVPNDIPSIDAQLRGSIRRPLAAVALVPARAPGKHGAFAVDLGPGRYALICFVKDEKGMSHGRMGMNSEFSVE